jgi:D-3-phosphoglycerate dehydrogenase
MLPLIVVSDGLDKDLFEQLKKTPQFEVHPQSKIQKTELFELSSKISGIIVRSNTQINKEFIDKAPQLKYVLRAGEGTDNIDTTYCSQKGIIVSNTPGANSLSAAELAIGQMFNLARHLSHAHITMKEGIWEKSKFTGFEISGKKIAVVGLGKIGKIVLKKLKGFEGEYYFFDPFVQQKDFLEATKLETLEEVFSLADIISLHLPYTPQTHNIINLNLMKKMKKNAILVNACRGNILNEEDLLKALNEDSFLGAALDVFSEEPLSENSPLRNHPKILVTPHLGASTQEAQYRVGEMALKQIRNFFIEGKIENQVLK